MQAITAILAHGGLEGIAKILKGATLATFIIVGLLVLCAAAWMFRDLFRFGRDGLPWLFPAGVAVLFGGFGFWFGGYPGALSAAVVIIPFGLGRYAAHRRRKRYD